VLTLNRDVKSGETTLYGRLDVATIRAGEIATAVHTTDTSSLEINSLKGNLAIAKESGVLESSGRIELGGRSVNMSGLITVHGSSSEIGLGRLGMEVVLSNGQDYVLGNDYLNQGRGIKVEPLSRSLRSGDKVFFSNGGVLVLVEDVAKGAREILGELIGDTVKGGDSGVVNSQYLKRENKASYHPDFDNYLVHIGAAEDVTISGATKSASSMLLAAGGDIKLFNNTIEVAPDSDIPANDVESEYRVHVLSDGSLRLGQIGISDGTVPGPDGDLISKGAYYPQAARIKADSEVLFESAGKIWIGQGADVVSYGESGKVNIDAGDGFDLRGSIRAGAEYKREDGGSENDFIKVVAIDSDFDSGDIIHFSGGGVLELSESAIKGDTTLKGVLSRAGLSAKETSVDLNISLGSESYEVGDYSGENDVALVATAASGGVNIDVKGQLILGGPDRTRPAGNVNVGGSILASGWVDIALEAGIGHDTAFYMNPKSQISTKAKDGTEESSSINIWADHHVNIDGVVESYDSGSDVSVNSESGVVLVGVEGHVEANDRLVISQGLRVTINNPDDTYDSGDYKESGILVDSIGRTLRSGHQIEFEQGQKFTLSADAESGATTIYGTLAGTLENDDAEKVRFNWRALTAKVSSVKIMPISISDWSAKATTVDPHPYQTGDIVQLSGATGESAPIYNRSFVITRTGDNSFTFDVPEHASSQGSLHAVLLREEGVFVGANLQQPSVTALEDYSKVNGSIKVDKINSSIELGQIIYFSSGSITLTEQANKGSDVLYGTLEGDIKKDSVSNRGGVLDASSKGSILVSTVNGHITMAGTVGQLSPEAFAKVPEVVISSVSGDLSITGNLNASRRIDLNAPNIAVLDEAKVSIGQNRNQELQSTDRLQATSVGRFFVDRSQTTKARAKVTSVVPIEVLASEIIIEGVIETTGSVPRRMLLNSTGDVSISGDVASTGDIDVRAGVDAQWDSLKLVGGEIKEEELSSAILKIFASEGGAHLEAGGDINLLAGSDVSISGETNVSQDLRALPEPAVVEETHMITRITGSRDIQVRDSSGKAILEEVEVYVWEPTTLLRQVGYDEVKIGEYWYTMDAALHPAGIFVHTENSGKTLKSFEVTQSWNGKDAALPDFNIKDQDGKEVPYKTYFIEGVDYHKDGTMFHELSEADQDGVLKNLGYTRVYNFTCENIEYNEIREGVKTTQAWEQIKGWEDLNNKPIFKWKVDWDLALAGKDKLTYIYNLQDYNNNGDRVWVGLPEEARDGMSRLGLLDNANQTKGDDIVEAFVGTYHDSAGVTFVQTKSAETNILKPANPSLGDKYFIDDDNSSINHKLEYATSDHNRTYAIYSESSKVFNFPASYDFRPAVKSVDGYLSKSTTILKESAIVDFGDLSSGDSSYEFYFRAEKISKTGSTAIAGNNSFALKLEQYNKTA
ncbi:hypothetical protein OAA59_02435, partial [bacterium]|nr:hypothetical protein [bacterium]